MGATASSLLHGEREPGRNLDWKSVRSRRLSLHALSEPRFNDRTGRSQQPDLEVRAPTRARR